MENLNKIKKLLTDSSQITNLFKVYIPKWKNNPSHYDKVGYGFNIDSRFSACNPVTVRFCSYEGVYGDSGSSTVCSFDSDIFNSHLLKYLNKNKEDIMLSVAKSIQLEAKQLKEKAEAELNQQLEKLKFLDQIQ